MRQALMKLDDPNCDCLHCCVVLQHCQFLENIQNGPENSLSITIPVTTDMLKLSSFSQKHTRLVLQVKVRHCSRTLKVFLNAAFVVTEC